MSDEQMLAVEGVHYVRRRKNESEADFKKRKAAHEKRVNTARAYVRKQSREKLWADTK